MWRADLEPWPAGLPNEAQSWLALISHRRWLLSLANFTLLCAFREASAEDLPFAPSSFDCVVSSFGIGHFSAPGRALAEFARVLAPKGRVALSWWDGFEKNRINGIFFDVISGKVSANLSGSEN
jgi:ubiquinone/menaquinone biosynthesis C-methylase UbiE